jgi:hypothetical protein
VKALGNLTSVRLQSFIADAIALLAFVTVGVLTHDASWTAFVRDALCFLGGWFAAGLVSRRLLVQWLLGISAAVAVRALIVGHWSWAFYGVALAFTLVFVYAVRFSATAWRRSRISSASAPTSSRRGSCDRLSSPNTRSNNGVVR